MYARKSKHTYIHFVCSTSPGGVAYATRSVKQSIIKKGGWSESHTLLLEKYFLDFFNGELVIYLAAKKIISEVSLMVVSGCDEVNDIPNVKNQRHGDNVW